MDKTIRMEKGQTANDAYRIEKFLGEGGLAYNYLAFDLKNRRNVVLKQTKRPVEMDGKFSDDRFQVEREFRILQQFDLPSIPTPYKMFEIDDVLYFTREYRPGRTLDVAVEDGIKTEKIKKYSRLVLEILEYIHAKNIIYRDLKPDNVIIDDDDEVFLFDFGTCRYYKQGKKHDTIALGTPGFAAPEQYGKRQTDVRADVYSFGALLYYMLTGDNPEKRHNPFDIGKEENLRQKEVDPELRDVLKRCLALDPDERYENVRLLKSRLFRAFDSIKGGSPRPEMIESEESKIGQPLGEFNEDFTEGIAVLGLLFPFLLLIGSQFAFNWRTLILMITFILVVFGILIARVALISYVIGPGGFAVDDLFRKKEYRWDDVDRMYRRGNLKRLHIKMKSGRNIVMATGNFDDLCRLIERESGIKIDRRSRGFLQ